MRYLTIRRDAGLLTVKSGPSLSFAVHKPPDFDSDTVLGSALSESSFFVSLTT